MKNSNFTSFTEKLMNNKISLINNLLNIIKFKITTHVKGKIQNFDYAFIDCCHVSDWIHWKC